MMGLTEEQDRQRKMCQHFGLSNLWHTVMLYRHYKPIVEDLMKDAEKYEAHWNNFMRELETCYGKDGESSAE